MRTPVVPAHLRRERWIKLGAFLSLLLLVGLVIFFVQNLLVAFLLAFVMSYLQTPAANFLESRGTSRVQAVVILFGVLALGLSAGVYLIAPRIWVQVESLRDNLPTYLNGTKSIIMQLEQKLSFLNVFGYEPNFLLNELGFSAAEGRINEKSLIQKNVEQWINNLPGLIQGSITVLVLAPFLAFFMLKDGRDIVRSAIGMVPNSVFELTLNLQHRINQQIGSFIRARLLEALIVGFVTWVGLSLAKIEYALVLSIFAGVTNLIPYVGPLIGAAPAYVISIINGASYFDIVMITIVYAVAQILDVVVLIPMMVAKLVNLHPVLVVMALIIGAQLLGVLGMLIAIPLASALKVTVVTIYDHLLDFRS